MSENNSKRIGFIDSMRGFTMFLVVYHHICSWIFPIDSTIEDVFTKFMMPLFFFISGLMVYTQRPYKEWINKKFKTRLLNQFLPTFFTGFLFYRFASLDVKESFFAPEKEGYWFTLVLFGIFIFYLFLTVVFEKIKFSKFKQLVAFIVVMLISFYLYKYLRQTGLYKNRLMGLFCIDIIVRYTFYFILGVICRMYLSDFQKLVANKYFNLCCLAAFVLCYFYYMNYYILACTGIFIVYHIFEYNKDFFSNSTSFGKMLGYVGRNTLPIYFLHYFILRGLYSIGDNNFLELLSNNWYIELLACSSLAILIIAATLVLNKVIESFSLLHVLMFGPKLKK